jgi:hypothetical protein
MRPKWTVGREVVAAGHYTGGAFDGADTVPYNGVSDALDLWDKSLSDRRLTILDGDRFSSSKVERWFRERGHPTIVAHLTASAELLAARRLQRGSNQNAAWMKGRATKAERFARRFASPTTIVIDQSITSVEVARLIDRIAASEHWAKEPPPS